MQDITTFISNHPYLVTATFIAFLLIIIIEMLRAKQANFGKSPLEITKMINQENAVILDVRSPDLYRKGHIIDAHSFNAKELALSKKLEKFRTRPLIVICASGIESQKIAASLIKQGYNAYFLNGGMRAWVDAQMPLVKE
jgi:rhodanese-related sulfurtransferase